MKPSIEMSFYAFQRLYHTFQLLISGQHNEGGICSRLPGGIFRVQAPGREDPVVFVADFSDRGRGASRDEYSAGGGGMFDDKY